MTQPILAAERWPTNADMIVACAQLGYLRDSDTILDPTYGEGGWWTKWMPRRLIIHDFYTLDDVDFRNLPEPDGSVNVVAFDPPYVSVGGRKTSTLPRYQARYGMDRSGKTPAEVQELMDLGTKEAYRVLKPKGVLLLRCQDYISGGKFWPGTFYSMRTAVDCGFTLVDRLERISSPRPQPSGRTQRHARRNLSTLLVFRS